jgi:hypothetical protein
VKKEKGQHEVDVLAVENLLGQQGEFGTKGVENNHTGNPLVKPGRFNVAM